MILTKAKLDEAHELSFGLSVMGTAAKAENVRFVIEGKEFDISIPCTRNGDDVTVSIPKLKGILESGNYDVRMEVVVDGRIFTPLNESIEFEPLIEFDVKKGKAESIKEGVRVTLKTPSVSEDSKDKVKMRSPLEESLRKMMEEGYDVAKTKDIYTIKKDEGYIGVVRQDGQVVMFEETQLTFAHLQRELAKCP